MPVEPKGKVIHKYEKSCHTRISDHRKETTSEQSSPVWKFNTDLILLLLFYVQAAFTINDFAHVGAYGRTQEDRNMHALTLYKNYFSKPGQNDVTFFTNIDNTFNSDKPLYYLLTGGIRERIYKQSKSNSSKNRPSMFYAMQGGKAMLVTCLAYHKSPEWNWLYKKWYG